MSMTERQFTPAQQRVILARAHRDELRDLLVQADEEVRAALQALAKEEQTVMAESKED